MTRFGIFTPFAFTLIVFAYLAAGWSLVARRYTTWRNTRLLRTRPHLTPQQFRDRAATGVRAVVAVWPVTVTVWALARALHAVTVVISATHDHITTSGQR